MSTSTDQYEDKSAFVPAQTNGILNAVTGLLSKAADTALDVWAMKEEAKIVGTVYPTGQVNPQAAPQINKVEAMEKPNYTPYYIAGGVVVVLLVVLAVKK